MKKFVLILAMITFGMGVFYAQEAKPDNVDEAAEQDAGQIPEIENPLTDRIEVADVPSNSRAGKNEIYASYGSISLLGGILELFGCIANGIAGNQQTFIANAGIGYNHWFTDNVAAGVSVGYQGLGFEGNSSINVIDVQAKVTFEYGHLANDHISFYNTLSAGVALIPSNYKSETSEGEKDNVFVSNPISPAFNVTVFGMKVKVVDPVSLFVEVNAPYAPILNGGVSVRW